MTTPSRPELDAWIDPAWGQWVHDAVEAQPAKVAYKGFTTPTVAAGTVTVTAAQLGLTTVDGVVGGLLYSTTVGNPNRMEFRVMNGGTATPSAGTSVQGTAYTNTGGAIAAGVSVTFWVIAWGA